jgi:hypothetical protein
MIIALIAYSEVAWSYEDVLLSHCAWSALADRLVPLSAKDIMNWVCSCRDRIQEASLPAIP